MRESELLTGLSTEELEALADSLLAPAAQARLDDLLARRKEGPLSSDEDKELATRIPGGAAGRAWIHHPVPYCSQHPNLP